MSLTITLGLLVVEFIVIGVCYWQDKKPPDPAKPRLFPYRFVMVTMAVIILGTLAHVITLVTGNQVMPRNKMYK